VFEIPESFLNNNIQAKAQRDTPFSDCVMYRKNVRGYTYCDGLIEMLCETCGKCKFYKKGEKSND
jgi:hypothetical protein